MGREGQGPIIVKLTTSKDKMLSIDRTTTEEKHTIYNDSVPKLGHLSIPILKLLY